MNDDFRIEDQRRKRGRGGRGDYRTTMAIEVKRRKVLVRGRMVLPQKRRRKEGKGRDCLLLLVLSR